MRLFLLAFVSFIFATNSAASKYYYEMEGDNAIGSNDAKITIIEYSSITCPHCADFHNDIYPFLKQNYIDTGKVRFIHRNSFYPKDFVALKTSMIPFCAGDRYFTFLKALYKTQRNWLFETRKPFEVISDIAKLGGMNSEEFDNCVKNKQIEEKILEQVLVSRNELDIQATPSFIINGKIYKGFLNKQSLKKIIDDLK